MADTIESNNGLRRRQQSAANPNDSADKSAGSFFHSHSTSSFEINEPSIATTLTSPPQAAESKPMKILTRAISGLIMITLFIGILLSGHLYVCAFVGLLQILLFRELVTVRYAAHFDRIEQTIPLFRTTQWMWFFTSLFYTYSEFVVEVLIKSNTSLHGFIDYAQLAPALRIFTVIVGWYLSRYLAQFTWMTCPTNKVFELFPRALIHSFSNVVEICSNGGDTTNTSPCISGAVNQRHHHYELALTIVPVQLHAISLSLFASLVAPFGGFLASGIKRAYRIKDFDSIIPGHGGLMDRFDCQMIMALFTWVHYNTFIKITTVSVAKMLYMYKLLKIEDREEFLRRIVELDGEG
eukprot:scaffold15946_cov31-Cyclotella_meneghiniana.AAC.1